MTLTHIRTLIVDDQPNLRNELRFLIERQGDFSIIGECATVKEARRVAVTDKPDLIFLDVQLPDGTGFDVLENLPAEFKIIFLTAFEEHAIRAIKYGALDYLLKPITLKRFLVTVQKVEQCFVGESSHGGYFFIKSGTEHRKILLNEILFFESRKEYVRVVTVSFEVLTYRRLKDIEAQLPLPFTRVHQSFIVNLQQLVKIQDNHIHIGDTRIPIGDKFRDGLMELVRKRTF